MFSSEIVKKIKAGPLDHKLGQLLVRAGEYLLARRDLPELWDEPGARSDKGGARLRLMFIRKLSNLVENWTNVNVREELAAEVATFADVIFPGHYIDAVTVRKALDSTTTKGR